MKKGSELHSSKDNTSSGGLPAQLEARFLSLVKEYEIRQSLVAKSSLEIEKKEVVKSNNSLRLEQLNVEIKNIETLIGNATLATSRPAKDIQSDLQQLWRDIWNNLIKYHKTWNTNASAAAATHRRACEEALDKLEDIIDTLQPTESSVVTLQTDLVITRSRSSFTNHLPPPPTAGKLLKPKANDDDDDFGGEVVEIGDDFDL